MGPEIVQGIHIAALSHHLNKQPDQQFKINLVNRIIQRISRWTEPSVPIHRHVRRRRLARP